jgi:hypothetical protein
MIYKEQIHYLRKRLNPVSPMLLNFLGNSPQQKCSWHTSGFNGSLVEKAAAPVASEKAGKEEVKVLNKMLNLRTVSQHRIGYCLCWM